eukprot:15454142-Alexandrium_andersonii.AAC.1
MSASMESASHPPVADRSQLDRSRSRLGMSVAKAKGGSTPMNGLSPTYTLQQREALIQRLQEELAAGRMRSIAVQSSRAANEHLEQLAREDAARAQAEQVRVTQDAMNESSVLRATVQARANGEQALATARLTRVVEVEQVAEHMVNAEASNAQELQRELHRVVSQSEAEQARLAAQARQEIALVQTVLSSTEGQSEQAHNRA